MPSQRIKGQEITILVVRDSALEAELTDVQNFNAELTTEILDQGYLGEKTNRKDEVYRGAKLDFELHSHSQDFLTFITAILDRAKRNTPDTVINISAVMSFPNGQTPTILFPDVKFGPIPLNVPERGDYFKLKFEGAVDDVEISLT